MDAETKQALNLLENKIISMGSRLRGELQQGGQGPTGPQGPAGPQGVQGESGATGARGEQGSQGELGLQGAQGQQGVPGEQGIQGIPGPQGDVGPQGPAAFASMGITAGASRSETGNQTGDILFITVKGDWTGSASAQTVTLTVAGASADAVGVKQAATADKLPWSLVALYVCPNANNVAISVAASAGTLANVKISVLKKR